MILGVFSFIYCVSESNKNRTIRSLPVRSKITEKIIERQLCVCTICCTPQHKHQSRALNKSLLLR